VNIPEDLKIKLQPGEKVLAIRPDPRDPRGRVDLIEVVIEMPPEKGKIFLRFRKTYIALCNEEHSHHVEMLFPVFHAAHKAMREAIDPFIVDDRRDMGVD